MERWSPYVSNYDNPIRYEDHKGDCPTCVWGFIIGAGVDYAKQVVENKLDGKNWNDALTDINLVELGTASLAGAATAGVSAIYSAGAAAGTTFLVSEVATQATLSGVGSIVGQIDKNIKTNKPVDDISMQEVAVSVFADHIGGRITDKMIPTVNVSSLERQVDRAGRVAVNSTRPGRINSLTQAQALLSSTKVINSNQRAVTSGTLSYGVEKATKAVLKYFSKPPVKAPARDNTNVVIPVNQ
jgi:hypothetical protein